MSHNRSIVTPDSGEVNTHCKNNHDGSATTSGSMTTDAGWLRKALKRAKEQAAEQNTTLEEIATHRWGSLEKFYSLLEEAEKPAIEQSTRGNSRHRDSEKYRERRRRSRSTERRRSRSRERKRSRSKERRRSRSREEKWSRAGEGDGRHRNDEKSVKAKMMRPASDDEDSSNMYKSQRSSASATAGKGWRRKQDIRDEPKIVREEILPESIVKEITPHQHENVVAEIVDALPDVKILTDQELNKLAAKLTKAELMGNDALAEKLRNKLAASRKARDSNSASNQSSKHATEEVLLTKTMTSGYTMPMSQGESVPGKRKAKMAAFLEESRNLKQMFQHEKGISAEEQNEVAEEAALQMGAMMEEDYDDVGGASDALHKQIGRLQDKQRQRAILEHQSNEKSLDSCTWCMANKDMKKHLVVSLGTKCYLALLPHEEISNGQCVIAPIHHISSSLLADEDLWEEIMDLRKALVNFYQSRDEDCVFFETYLKSKSRIPHMVIHCIPLPREVGDLSPIYFKKAIDECEAEWSQNKKLVDLKGKGVRKCVPKELSYFYVDFGNCPGYAHVIEDERIFPRKFAEEIVGGMLDAEAFLWLRPPKQPFDLQCKKVMQFADDFKLFDPNSK